MPHDPAADAAALPAVVAVVQTLQRFPLKSAAGETVTTATLDAQGVVGDRGWVLHRGDCSVVRPRDCAALAGLSASDVDLDGETLTRLTGVEGAHVARAEPLQSPRAAVHLVGADAADDPRAPSGADPGRRANLVLSSGAGALMVPGAERGWEGATLLVGTAELVVTRLPGHCLGVYADVVVPGAVTLGDPVRLAPLPRG